MAAIVNKAAFSGSHFTGDGSLKGKTWFCVKWRVELRVKCILEDQNDEADSVQFIE